MSHHADRIRDDIERVASGDFASILEELDKLEVAITYQGAAVSRLLAEHGTGITDLWDNCAELRDEVHAVANRVESAMRGLQDTATLQDVADLRSDLLEIIAEATATPFNPPEARE